MQNNRSTHTSNALIKLAALRRLEMALSILIELELEFKPFET